MKRHLRYSGNVPLAEGSSNNGSLWRLNLSEDEYDRTLLLLRSFSYCVTEWVTTDVGNKWVNTYGY